MIFKRTGVIFSLLLTLLLLTGCGDESSSDGCKTGATETEKCGSNDNGERTRTCMDKKWTEWSICKTSGECVNDATEDQPCGLNNNGKQTRTCTDKTWGEFGDCIDPDVCTNDATENQKCGENDAGTQNRRCTDGQWGEWSACEMPGDCTDGETEDQSCGLNNNGKSTRTCSAGIWGEYGDCIDPDSCKNDATQTIACGEGDAGTQAQTCINGQWSNTGDCVIPGACTDGATEDQTCGLNGNGKETRTCTDGSWGEYGECVDPDNCKNDDTQTVACGDNDAGTQLQTCVNGQWDTSAECVIEGCTDGQRLVGDPCGTDGEMIQVCRDGEWSEALCHEKDGDTRTFTVYVQTEEDALTSYLMDAAESAWNIFESIHLGLKGIDMDDAVGYHPALRFNNVQIPTGAEIIEVTLSFYPNSDVDNDKLRINIYGEKSVDSIPYDASNYTSNRPDQRLKTEVKVPANTNNPESWRIECVSDCCKDEPDCTFLWRYDCPQRKLDCWKKDTRYTVPHDLSPILTEITGVAGWLDGNSISLLLESALGMDPDDKVGTRTINDFDERGVEYNPSLTVKYRLP